MVRSTIIPRALLLRFPMPSTFTPQNIPTNKKNAQNRNRTSDTRIFSPLLYQLSYLGKQDSATHVTESRIKWAEVDSNHRSKLQQIYSLSPLATRESTHITLTSQNDSI